MIDRPSPPPPTSSPEVASSTAELRQDGLHWVLRPSDPPDFARNAPLGVVPALERAIAIIAYLNRAAPRPVALAELSATLEISKSHCFSLLKTLVHYDWLHFDAATKTYRLQSGILRDAASVLNDSATIELVRPALATLVDRVRVPCLLSRPLVDDSFVVVDRFDAGCDLEIAVPVGHRFPRDACAQMRAYLAWSDEERVERWFRSWHPLRYTERTLIDAGAIRAEIAATRRRGYARSLGEFTDGLMALALPLFDRHGEVAFVFNCSSLLPMLKPRETDVASAMIETARDIHRALGAPVPKDFPQAPVANEL